MSIYFNTLGVLNWIEKRLELTDTGRPRYAKIWGDPRMSLLNFDFILALFFLLSISLIFTTVWFWLATVTASFHSDCRLNFDVCCMAWSNRFRVWRSYDSANAILFYFIFSHLAGILSWIPQHVFNTLQKSTTLSRTTAEKHKRHFFKRQFCQSFKISARTARQGSICHAIYCQCFYHYQGLSWRITISNSEFTIMKEKPYQNKCCEILNTFNTLYSSVS